eukprot:g19164.t1
MDGDYGGTAGNENMNVDMSAHQDDSTANLWGIDTDDHARMTEIAEKGLGLNDLRNQERTAQEKQDFLKRWSKGFFKKMENMEEQDKKDVLKTAQDRGWELGLLQIKQETQGILSKYAAMEGNNLPIKPHAYQNQFYGQLEIFKVEDHHCEAILEVHTSKLGDAKNTASASAANRAKKGVGLVAHLSTAKETQHTKYRGPMVPGDFNRFEESFTLMLGDLFALAVADKNEMEDIEKLIKQTKTQYDQFQAQPPNHMTPAELQALENTQLLVGNFILRKISEQKSLPNAYYKLAEDMFPPEEGVEPKYTAEAAKVLDSLLPFFEKYSTKALLQCFCNIAKDFIALLFAHHKRFCQDAMDLVNHAHDDIVARRKQLAADKESALRKGWEWDEETQIAIDPTVLRFSKSSNRSKRPASVLMSAHVSKKSVVVKQERISESLVEGAEEEAEEEAEEVEAQVNYEERFPLLAVVEMEAPGLLAVDFQGKKDAQMEPVVTTNHDFFKRNANDKHRAFSKEDVDVLIPAPYLQAAPVRNYFFDTRTMTDEFPVWVLVADKSTFSPENPEVDGNIRGISVMQAVVNKHAKSIRDAKEKAQVKQENEKADSEMNVDISTAAAGLTTDAEPEVEDLDAELEEAKNKLLGEQEKQKKNNATAREKRNTFDGPGMSSIPKATPDVDSGKGYEPFARLLTPGGAGAKILELAPDGLPIWIAAEDASFARAWFSVVFTNEFAWPYLLGVTPFLKKRITAKDYALLFFSIIFHMQSRGKVMDEPYVQMHTFFCKTMASFIEVTWPYEDCYLAASNKLSEWAGKLGSFPSEVVEGCPDLSMYALQTIHLKSGVPLCLNPMVEGEWKTKMAGVQLDLSAPFKAIGALHTKMMEPLNSMNVTFGFGGGSAEKTAMAEKNMEMETLDQGTRSLFGPYLRRKKVNPMEYSVLMMFRWMDQLSKLDISEITKQIPLPATAKAPAKGKAKGNTGDRRPKPKRDGYVIRLEAFIALGKMVISVASMFMGTAPTLAVFKVPDAIETWDLKCQNLLAELSNADEACTTWSNWLEVVFQNLTADVQLKTIRMYGGEVPSMQEKNDRKAGMEKSEMYHVRKINVGADNKFFNLLAESLQVNKAVKTVYAPMGAAAASSSTSTGIVSTLRNAHLLMKAKGKGKGKGK